MNWLDDVVIIGANSVCMLVIYVLGFHRGRRKQEVEPPPQFLTKNCLCGHDVVNHHINPKGRRTYCTVMYNIGKNSQSNCACTGYVSDKELVE